MRGPVTVAVGEGVARLTFSEPARGNPLDQDFAVALARCLDEVDADASVRSVLLSAQGPNFSVGGDVRFFQEHADTLDATFARLFSVLYPALEQLAALEVPVVAAVQGWCVGGGLGPAALADVVVGGASARFGAAFTKVGLSNDSGTTWALAQRVGSARARRFFLLNETWDAETAQSSGLVDVVVPDEELAAHAEALADQLAHGPTVALAGIKRSFAAIGPGTLGDALRAEAAAMASSTGTVDAREGLAAFAEKRPPRFVGR